MSTTATPTSTSALLAEDRDQRLGAIISATAGAVAQDPSRAVVSSRPPGTRRDRLPPT